MKEMQEFIQEYKKPKMSEEHFLKMRQEIEKAKRKKRWRTFSKRVAGWGVAAAGFAVVLLVNTSATIAHTMQQIPVLGSLIEVVTFREYAYDDGKKQMEVKVNQLKVNSKEAKNESAGQKMQLTADEINQEIQSITNRIVEEFQSEMTQESYENRVVKTKVICTTEEFFTIQLICLEIEASSAQQSYYYTIDLESGNHLKMKDLFLEDAPYLERVSEEIKRQMREQIKEDNSKSYWIDNQEDWEETFQGIDEKTDFYVNEQKELVVCFDQGEVAPMSMGNPQFVIDRDKLKDILK